MKYRFHWIDKKVQEFEGDNPADALNKAGYGQGALRALDYWEIIDLESQKQSLLNQ